MAQVVIRGVDDEVLNRLKKRATDHKRSLQAELKLILEQASEVNVIDARALAERIRQELSGRQHSDSVELIREDRNR
jgi:antitoxin FitA